MTYIFKYKRRFFTKSIEVIGHQYTPEQNKMVIHLKDGSVKEIKNWTECEISLGRDWVDVTKKQMEDQAGISVPLKV